MSDKHDKSAGDKRLDRPQEPQEDFAADETGNKPVRGPENIDGGKTEREKHHPKGPPPEA
ncbi:cobaltochelatase [Oceanicola granulosus HTCC2516]|uniref:Cobaltochelatase n=1 Tax=Oceanicola granulosus (strain ATCC BAA-861 / DSM 15982 / KCTC 12143 / HTCC2516) TaxID=314256 RepID=Q2CK35_OCEGH|nr:hypothetical protein [Oceanicola granulosus]EAR52954.1 cobaltochelatase [Oceanicola granulosus HTCC2516]